jgi:hypothetical protein
MIDLFFVIACLPAPEPQVQARKYRRYSCTVQQAHVRTAFFAMKQSNPWLKKNVSSVSVFEMMGC